MVGPTGTSTPSEVKRGLLPAVAAAWRAFDRASALSSRVTPAAPILFFGNLDAYLTSRLRVLTVGLNPSLHEFPRTEPFQRFPLAGEGSGREPDQFLDAMSAYFRTEPYHRWFSAFEKVLNGAGVSYYTGKAASTALHTDICSPVATDPTWSKLPDTDRRALERDGVPLWHMLLEALRPQVVVLSVAEKHLEHIRFTAFTRWQTAREFEWTSGGERRRTPYRIRARWYKVAGRRSLFVFGRAAQTPFGLLSHDKRDETGAIAAETYLEG